MVQKSHEQRRKYWATRLSVCSFAGSAHSIAGYALLATLARSAALIRLLAFSITHSRARGKVYDWMSGYDLVLSYSTLASWIISISAPSEFQNARDFLTRPTFLNLPFIFKILFTMTSRPKVNKFSLTLLFIGPFHQFVTVLSKSSSYSDQYFHVEW